MGARLHLTLLLYVLCSQPLFAGNPQVEFTTSHGNFVIELYPDKAPKTVANFLEYVNDGFYHQTIFHRVIEGFVIQGGGYTRDLQQKRTQDPIPNEANNGLRNERGTIAMARNINPNSAAAQFFINLGDNKTLNYYRPDPAHMGYCVFGRVIRGMEVIERIAHVPTHTVEKLSHVPTEPVVIEKADVLENPIYAEQVPENKTEPSPFKPTKSSKKGKKRG